ncbi:MAG: hypothetical protein JO281_18085 [Pseudonocardiales bacterium]|nr:hypothetical protein [Pseudonocardiales bacterium]
MSQTPIYDQLRGERINAEVPATETDPQGVNCPKERRLPAGAASAADSRPPEATDDFTVNQYAAEWGPRAALPPITHARPAHARPTHGP